MTILRTERTLTGCDSRVYKSQGDHSILMEMLLVWEELQEKFRRTFNNFLSSLPLSLSAGSVSAMGLLIVLIGASTASLDI